MYLTDLKRLAKLACINVPGVIECAFVDGLPDTVGSMVQAPAKSGELSFVGIVSQAKIFISKQNQDAVYVAEGDAKEEASYVAVLSQRPPLRCFQCGKSDHLFRNCINTCNIAPPLLECSVL